MWYRISRRPKARVYVRHMMVNRTDWSNDPLSYYAPLKPREYATCVHSYSSWYLHVIGACHDPVGHVTQGNSSLGANVENDDHNHASCSGETERDRKAGLKRSEVTEKT